MSLPSSRRASAGCGVTRSGWSAELVASAVLVVDQLTASRTEVTPARADVDGDLDRALGRPVDQEDRQLALVVRRHRVDRRDVAVLGRLVRRRVDLRRRSTWPAASREACANGWKVVCRQAGPPGSVMIGAITLTSWARQATVTRSLCRSSEISRLPTTTASVTLYSSSSSRGRHRPVVARLGGLGSDAALVPDVPLVEGDVDLLACACSCAPTWSAVATTDVDEVVHVDGARPGSEPRSPSSLLVVGVAGDVVDQVVRLRAAPSPPTRRTSACRELERAAGDQLEVGVDHAASPGRSRRRAGRTPSAVLWPICQGPSISLPRHHSLMPYGSLAPCATRRSDSAVPPGWLEYSSRSSASCDAAGAEVDRHHRLDAGLARTSAMNSSRPNCVGLDACARPGRAGAGRSSRGPTPSSQR